MMTLKELAQLADLLDKASQDPEMRAVDGFQAGADYAMALGRVKIELDERDRHWAAENNIKWEKTKR